MIIFCLFFEGLPGPVAAKLLYLTFEMQGRAKRWCFTLNNYTPEEERRFWNIGREIEALEWIEYLIYGREVGEQGTPHLQGFLICRDRLRWNQLNQMIFGTADYGRVHWEVARSTPENCINYCKKEGNYEEWGEQQAKKVNQWDDIKQMIEEGRPIEDIRDKYPATWTKYRTSLTAWVNEGRQARLQHYDGDLQEKNMWIWGPAGIGKSRKAREVGESFFNKGVNKWWDGYNGEGVVIMEDVDPERCKMLVHHLKIWLDRYIFTAEVKQSSVVLSPRNFRMIITSNYSPEQCFNETDLEAIRRRLRVIHMDKL